MWGRTYAQVLFFTPSPSTCRYYLREALAIPNLGLFLTARPTVIMPKKQAGENTKKAAGNAKVRFSIPLQYSRCPDC